MIHHLEAQVLILLFIASLVGMLARRLRVPYTLALVVAGLALSFLELESLRDLALTPELLLLLFLPPLLFEAAYHLPFQDLKRNAGHIGYLALAGVLVSVGLTAVGAYAGLGALGLAAGFGWPQAFLFASVIAATDPISVLALFKELGAPKRLYQIVEGESLINDGVAVAVFLIVGAVLGLPSAHVAHAPFQGLQDIVAFSLVTFLKTSVGGIVVGAGVGAAASVLTRQIDDHLIEVTLTTLVAWGSFLLAEQLHVSGVLSTVTAGIVMGSFGKHFGMSASTRIAVHDFWQYMGFLSNSFIFLLVGLELDAKSLFPEAAAIAWAFVAVVVARAAMVYAGVPLVDRFATTPLPTGWRHVLVWGGLRGSLSMVLIIGLPSDTPGRPLLINLVFGVVAVSLFLQGLTMAPLMRWLGAVSAGVTVSPEYENARGRAIAFRSALLEAHRQLEQGLLDESTHRELAEFYKAGHDRARSEATELAGATAAPELLHEAARSLAMVEREAIAQAVAAGVILEATGAALLTQLDGRLDELRHAAHQGEDELVSVFRRLYGKTPPG